MGPITNSSTASLMTLLLLNAIFVKRLYYYIKAAVFFGEHLINIPGVLVVSGAGLGSTVMSLSLVRSKMCLVFPQFNRRLDYFIQR